jgi:hypothetical protein
MGNDGGSIPKRRELVKEAARAKTVSELKATAMESLENAWVHDPLTSEVLDLENVVSDWRGRIYNYESILKALLPSDDNAPDSGDSVVENGESQELTFAATGIKSLRDIVRLKFKKYANTGSKKEIWACPVSLKELGPATKAVYIVPCGHVFADMAMKQIQEERCPECSEEFKPEDIVPILATEKSELEKLSARMESLKARSLTHSLKKDKSGGKKKKRKGDEAREDGKEVIDGPKEKKVKETKSDISSRVSGINNAATASLTARVLAEQEERNRRRKLAAPR